MRHFGRVGISHTTGRPQSAKISSEKTYVKTLSENLDENLGENLVELFNVSGCGFYSQNRVRKFTRMRGQGFHLQYCACFVASKGLCASYIVTAYS